MSKGEDTLVKQFLLRVQDLPAHDVYVCPRGPDLLIESIFIDSYI